MTARIVNFIAIAALVFPGIIDAQPARRALAINQTRYVVRAGERIQIPAPAESLAFVRAAQTRTARASGRVIRNFAAGLNVAGDQILLGVPLTADPGDYSVDLSFVSPSGEERVATVAVTVQPFATVSSAEPPVVLLDGFQLSLTSSCPMSTDSTGTFGNLQSYLQGAPNNASVYFFENCTECPNCTIEQLGSDLGTFLNMLAVPQADVVAHSMGGLIVRSYLSGKQATPGAFNPPAAQQIRKAVFLATPHFGSFQADSALADELFQSGSQDNEMKPGSQFVWDLATWNQLSDDLRGVDAVAVIGNAGPSGQSDGVVDTTSASLDFAIPGRTRVVPYCHVSGSSFDGLAGVFTGCNNQGIADVDTVSHPTYQIVSSFLLNEASWQSVGTAPSADPYLSKDGGLIVADVSSQDQYVTPAAVTFGTQNLTQGAAPELYYLDFVAGSGTFNFGASTCGPFTETPGVYSAVRCKSSPAISSVGPLLAGSAKVVQAGGTITISGSGFGAQQCAACGVTAQNPGSTALKILSWSDSAITATLPASFGTGLVTIGVTAAGGSDAINIMAGLTPGATISLSTSSLNFSFVTGGAIPAAQTVTVSNTGSGALSYSVSSSASWLSAAASGATITVTVNPAGLTANAYQASILVSAPGASNTPQSIPVSLVVTGAGAPTVTITGITNAATSVSGPLAPGEIFTIKGTNLGPAAGVSFSLNAAGMVNTSLGGTEVMVGSIAAPILYSSATQINAVAPFEISGQSQVAVSVEYQSGVGTQAIQVQSASPGAFTLNSTGSGNVVAANQDGTINGPSNPAAKGSIVTVYWTGGGQTNPAGVTGSVAGAVLQWLTQPISVMVGNQPALVLFDGSAPTFVEGADQLNLQLAPNTPSGAQPLVITVGGISSPASGTISVQ